MSKVFVDFCSETNRARPLTFARKSEKEEEKETASFVDKNKARARLNIGPFSIGGSERHLYVINTIIS